MKLHEIGLPKGANKKPKRKGLGQGSGLGKTAGRGQTGQMSRSGSKAGGSYVGFEGGQMPLNRKIAKRGFTNIHRLEYQIINIKDLNKFKADETVDAVALEKKGLINGKRSRVKVLGVGDLNKSLTVKANKFSASAVKKILDAGGKVENA